MLRRLIGAVGIAGALTLLPVACAKKPLQAAPEPPAPLQIPVPPPRVLAPVPPAEPPPAPAEEPPADPPRPPRPRQPTRPATAPGDARPDPARLEGPPADAANPAGATDAKAEPATPALRTPQTANDSVSERRITDVLTRTRRSLGNVKRDQLSADAQAQFDTARRFIDQAEDALKVRNYMFAAYLADKAETLARGLTGR